MQLRTLTLLAALVVLQGCASFDGRMVNARGDQVDCSSMGGGIGLGAVIGAGIAIADNQICESNQREKGYVLHDDVGKSGIDLPADETSAPLVLAAAPPAAPCVATGDHITRIDNSQPSNVSQARVALFGERGQVKTVQIRRADTDIQCQVELD